MTAWYNEPDEEKAVWLEELIRRNLIAPGVVDRRDIRDVKASELADFVQCHFFAGIGGWSYSLRGAGWPDTRPVWTGSCPCGPFSAVGELERFADERHLWPDWVHLIRERKPTVVFGEQVASATEWLRLVRSDLEALGYAMGAAAIEAASAGAFHLRDRYWFVADGDQDRRAGECADPGSGSGSEPSKAWDYAVRGSNMGDASGAGAGRDGGEVSGTKARSKRARRVSGGVGDGSIDAGAGSGAVVDGERTGLEGHAWYGDRGGGRPGSAGSIAAAGADRGALEWYIGPDGKVRPAEPGICLVADGVPSRVGLLRGFGDAIDPRPAIEFIGAYMDILQNKY